MTCFELRRWKLAGARDPNAETLAHLRECPACAAFAESLDALEETLGTELRVPVPDGLADRVLLRLRQRTPYPRTQPSTAEQLRAVASRISGAVGLLGASWGRRAGLAVAAMLVLGMSIVFFQASPIHDEGLAIADIAYAAHVMQEQIQDLEGAPEADPVALPKVLAASGVRLPSDFREVRYLGRCGPPDHSGEHIMMQAQSVTASLVLMPNESARFRIVQFDDGRTVVVAPAPVGSLAVVADSRQAAVQIAERFL
jgi:hypothetical protein